MHQPVSFTADRLFDGCKPPVNRKQLKIMTVLAAVGAITLFGYPKRLPPDGTVEHTWKITAHTPTNTVLVIDGIAQDYWKTTHYPRRAFGNTIRYHWFRKPSLKATDADGNRWTGRMVR